MKLEQGKIYKLRNGGEVEILKTGVVFPHMPNMSVIGLVQLPNDGRYVVKYYSEDGRQLYKDDYAYAVFDPYNVELEVGDIVYRIVTTFSGREVKNFPIKVLAILPEGCVDRYICTADNNWGWNGYARQELYKKPNT